MSELPGSFMFQYNNALIFTAHITYIDDGRNRLGSSIDELVIHMDNGDTIVMTEPDDIKSIKDTFGMIDVN